MPDVKAAQDIGRLRNIPDGAPLPTLVLTNELQHSGRRFSWSAGFRQDADDCVLQFQSFIGTTQLRALFSKFARQRNGVFERGAEFSCASDSITIEEKDRRDNQ